MGSDDDKKSSTVEQVDSALGKSRFATAFETLGKGAQSPFVKKLLSLVAETTAPTSPASSILTQTQAAQLSAQLSEVLMGLTTACIDQRQRLTNGFLPWDKVNATRVMTSLEALVGITDRLSRSVASLVAASRQGSGTAQPSNPSFAGAEPGDTGPSLSIVRLARPQQRVAPDQIQRVAESLRAVHQYVIDVSGQIRNSIAGTAGTNAFALDGALAEANMLSHFLRDALFRLRDMLAGSDV